MSCLDLTEHQAFRTTTLLATLVLKDNIVEWPQLHPFMERYNLSTVAIAKMVRGMEKIPPSIYDFFITFMGIAMNVPVSIVCASCIYTNVPDAGQYQLLFPTSILLMCQEGELYILEKSNQKKHRLGMSPLYLFTKKSQDKMSRKLKHEQMDKELAFNKEDKRDTEVLSCGEQQEECEHPPVEQPELRPHTPTDEKPVVRDCPPVEQPELCEVTLDKKIVLCGQQSDGKQINEEHKRDTEVLSCGEQQEECEHPPVEQPEVRPHTPTDEKPVVHDCPPVKQPEVCELIPDKKLVLCGQQSDGKQVKFDICSPSDDIPMYDTESDNNEPNSGKAGEMEEIDVGMVVNSFIQTPIPSNDESSLDSNEVDIKLRLSQMSEIEASILLNSENYKQECSTDFQKRQFNIKLLELNTKQQTASTSTNEDHKYEVLQQQTIAISDHLTENLTENGLDAQSEQPNGDIQAPEWDTSEERQENVQNPVPPPPPPPL